MYADKLQRLRESYGNRCFFCRSTYNLEFFHIKPTTLSGRGRGQSRRYYDILRHPGHYGLACEEHHKLYDKHPDLLWEFLIKK